MALQVSPQLGPTQRRRFYRTHASTLVLLVPLAAILVLIVVPGTLSEDDSSVWCDQGWPWIYLHRQLISERALLQASESAVWENNGVSFPSSMPESEFLSALVNDPMRDSPVWRRKWAWWRPAEERQWHPVALVGDALVAALILISAGMLLEWRRRRHARAWQFSLRELVCTIAVLAGALAWWQANARQARAEAAAAETLLHGSTAHIHTVQSYCGPAWLTRLLGATHLGPFQRVTALNINSWGFAEPPAELASFPSLKSVSINAVWNARSFADWLQGIPPLDQVELATMYLDDDDLACLCRTGRVTSFTFAGHRHPRFTDAGLVSLVQLPKLQKLDLSHSRVTDVGLSQLAPLTTLRELSLESTKITDEGVGHVAALPNIEVLNLSKTLITDQGMRDLATMRKLQYLDLSATGVTTAGLARLSSLPHLKSLNLNTTNIGDEAVEGLKRMPSLQELGLSPGQMSKAARDALERSMPNLHIRP
jgi:hypothetical protein